MWHLDPKEKLESPFFLTLSRLLFIKHVCEHLEAVLAKVESALSLRLLRNGVRCKQSSGSTYRFVRYLEQCTLFSRRLEE